MAAYIPSHESGEVNIPKATIHRARLKRIIVLAYTHQEGGGGVGRHFPYILLNEIQTMFSDLAKQSARALPADLCTDHAHYVKNHKSTVLRRNKTWQSKAGLFLTIIYWQFANLMILCRFSYIVCGFLFLLNSFPLQNLECAHIVAYS